MPQLRKQATDTRFYISGHDVFVYKRNESKFFWCGFHSNGQIIRTSTKKENKKEAIVVAKQWFYQKKGEIDNGLFIVKKQSFSEVSKLALEDYEIRVQRGERKQTTLDGITNVINSRVLPYIKSIDIKKINNQTWLNFKRDLSKDYPKTSHATFHQYKNGIRTVLNYAFANNLIKELPEFKDEYQAKRTTKPRPPFNSSEYTKLHSAIKRHADLMKKENKLKHANGAYELYDFVIIGANTGMRVEELMAMRFSDVTVKEEEINNEIHKILLIENIAGKSGNNSCKSYIGAHAAFERIIQRRKIKDYKKSDEKVFLIKHRALFNSILVKENLKWAKTRPPRKRDFVSLRSTYIAFRLLEGVPIQDIAFNCRNSVEVIQNNYARDFGGILLKDINKTREKKIVKTVESGTSIRT